MTINYDFAKELRQLLSEEASTWVLSALRQDALVWGCLQDPDFSSQAIITIGSDPAQWTLANLSLLALGYDGSLEEASEDADLLELANTALEFTEENTRTQEINVLGQAAIIALNAANRTKVNGSWDGIPDIFLESPDDLHRLALACLYGFTPDPLVLLQKLMKHENISEKCNSVLHAVLANPQPIHEQEEILAALLTDLSINDVNFLLRNLHLQRPELAIGFAKDFVSTHSIPHNGRDFAHIIEQVSLLSDLLVHAEINTIAKLPENTASVQSKALQTVHQIKAEIAAQLAGAALAEGDIDTALSTWQRGGERRIAPRQNRTAPPPPELTIALLDGGYPADALALIPEPELKELDQTHPSHLIAAATLAKDEGNTDQAQTFAKQAFQNFVGWDLSADTDISVNTHYIRSYIQTNCALVKILSGLSLYPETVFAAKIGLKYQPNDMDLLTQYAHALRSTGDPASAAKTLYIAVSLFPSDEHLRRELITCLEEAEDWEAAFIEKCELLDNRFAPSPETTWPSREDQYALAKVSLLAEHPERTIEICQDLIQDDEQDGLAHATLGEAYMSLGNTDEALDHLDKATQYSPHQAFSWLALAGALKISEKPQKSLETLRAATHAVPTDPQIFYSLAENYLEQDEYSKALPVLQEAHRLVIGQQLDENLTSHNQAPIISSQIIPRISLELGKTLQVLGHHSEARQVLSTAYSTYPAYRGLAYSYAKSLLSLDDYAAAIPPLVIAVQAEPDELDPNLDYGRALLEVKTQPNEAIRVLRKSMEIAPSNPIVKALLAEALMDSGNVEDAMQTYSQVLESDLMDEPEWMSRISHGFGRTALLLEKPDIAIASLQEAVRVDPQNPEIFQTLAEAYTTADLTKEALDAARTAKQLAPDDVEMLTWFANTVLQLEQPGDAIPALTRAIQISPNNTALLIQLGYVQSLAGRDEAAAETYRQILSAENPHANELLDAAEGLKRLGDFTNAITCLELGIEQLSEPDSEFLKQLALAYKDSKQFERSLETLENAINLEPESTELLIAKADLLALLARPQAAEATLEHAINLHPENPILHQMMALFYRTTGQITKALSKAEELVAMYHSESQSSEFIASRALAAELARALLQHDYAIAILEEQPSVETTTESPIPDREKINSDGYNYKFQTAPYHCLLAEIALERGEEVLAANHLTEAVNLASEHPRVIALQSRLSLRTGDQNLAKQTFQTALESIEHDKETIKIPESSKEIDRASLYPNISKSHEEVCNQLAIAEAAVEIKQWGKSIEILEKTSILVPHEPLVPILIARVLVLRAEYQNFCQSLNVKTNSPGDIALSNEVYQSFTEYIKEAEDQLNSANHERQFDESLLIKRWKIRGNAIFQPNSLNLQTLEELAQYPDDRAALITFISSTKDLTSLSKIYKALKGSSDLQSQHHLMLAQVARSLSNGYRRQEDYEEAMKMMEAAIHQDSSEPLYHALMAEIAYKLGENEIALDSMHTALATWADEPRWHATAAKINTSEGNITAAIAHLKKAAELEPNHIPHHLSLGEILQKNGEYRAAIQTFEFALDLAPGNLEPYLYLAQAYLSLGEYEKAAGYAQSATTKAPDEIVPMLVSAEVALQAGNLRKAQKNTKSALNIDPQNPDALQTYAHLLIAQGHPEDALETLDQAIKLTVKPLKLQLERADLISSIRGSMVALQNLQELALEYPEDPAVHYHLAKALASAEQFEAAIFAAQKALKSNISPLDPKQLSQIHYLLGQLMRHAGQLDQSIYHLSESIRLTPIYLEPYLELGRAHQERRQHALSLQTYQKAITIAPDDPRPYCQAGLLLKESCDYQGAESMLRRAADLAPDDLSIHRQLGALVALNIVHNRRAIPKA